MYRGNGYIERHYPTMELEQIMSLPVKELADKDAILFLWTTLPMIYLFFFFIKARGFEYKTTAFVWVKLARHSDGIFWGLGYWTRSNVEICMLATKGHPKRVAKNIHQVIISHVEEHSKKPAEARRRIEALMGDVPKIELFARRPARGWDVWGNEVVSDIVMKESDGID